MRHVLLLTLWLLGPADTGSAHACSCTGPGSFPPDGAIDVPLDVEIVVFADESDVAHVIDGDGQEIPVDRRYEPAHFGTGSWQLVKPVQPLAPTTTYQVNLERPPLDVWNSFSFITGESSASSPASPAVESLQASYVDLAGCTTDSCGPDQAGWAITATFQPSDHAAFYVLDYTVDGQTETRRVPTPYEGHQQNSGCAIQPPTLSPGLPLCLAIRAVSANGDLSPPASTVCTMVEDCDAECSIEGLAACDIEIVLDVHPVAPDAGAAEPNGHADAGCRASGTSSSWAIAVLVLLIASRVRLRY